MVLPTQGGQWPPTEMKGVYADIQANDGWFTGTAVPATSPVTGVTTGLVQSIRQRIFGMPGTMHGNQIHVPVPATISRMSASLLFGEMFGVEFGNDHDADDEASGTIPQAVYDALTKRANELMDDHAHATLLEGAEFASAHGGVYFRVSWDREVAPNGAIISMRAADTAVPVFRFGRLVSVQFWDHLDDIANLHYTLIEEHTKGLISWALYEAEANGTLGNQVPLTTHPRTLHFQSFDKGTLVGKAMTIQTGSQKLTAVYMPNAKPNRALRKDPMAAQMGRSDYDEAGDLFAMLDQTLTSWDRDIRLGKTRVMIPKNMLKLGQPGMGATYDSDQELFLATDNAQVGALNDAQGQGNFQVIQPNIRQSEHQATSEYLFDRIYGATGYSAQSFGESGDMAKTATEVSNREKMTLKTRDAKVIIARPVMADLIAALLDVDYFVFPDRGVNRQNLDAEIIFPDAVGEDPSTLASTLLTLTQAEAISIEQKVRERKPDWDDQAVADEVNRIKEEYQIASNRVGRPGIVPNPSQTTDTAASVDPLNPETETVMPGASNAPGTRAEVTKK